MTIPFWCLLVGALLPYVWTTWLVIEKKKQLGSVDNKLPREQEAALKGRGARASGAHKNAFEAMAVFTPAVLVAHVANASPVWSMRLAIIWVVARVAHGIFYVSDLDRLRSFSFVVASGCCVALFLAAAGIL
jgi:uncharacterized MAPEG superfamily protein